MSFCVSAQSIPYSGINNHFLDLSTDELSYFSDTNQCFLLGTRILALKSFSSKESYTTYSIGLSFETNIRQRLTIIGLYDYLKGSFNPKIKNFQDSLGIYYPGFGVNENRVQLNFKYLANNFLDVDFGYGKQFIGLGYHSLLLSDIADSYPHLRLSTKFGPVKYYNLYTTFLNPSRVNFGRKKHATIHYLDFAITEKVHLGIFESVLWQSKSESSNKGYELAYLNPVIFYRPVEFSKQSDKGNALMGATFNIEFENIILYSQFILDDLNISRAKDSDDNYRSGFFQNKYGYQIGLKGNLKDVDFLIEYNQVQPYTYGHRTILQNYSHMNQALAHPLGANFRELINILQFNQGNLQYRLKSIFSVVGLDSIGTHYGQDIFSADYNASTGGQSSYGNFNGQGFRTNIFSFQPEVSYKLKSFYLFGSVYYQKKKSDLLNQTYLFYTFGLRTFPFSAIPDY